jgi:hypothetical protein
MPANRQNNSNFFSGVNLFNNATGVQSFAGARESAISALTSQATPSSGAPTAAAAPTPGTNILFTGLCDALNQHQQSLVKNGTYEYADEYVIKFAPAALGASTVMPPGPVIYNNTATQNPNTASAKLDPKTNSVKTNTQIWEVLGGTQIVQFIDQVMRGSSYIRDQQKAQIDINNKQSTSTKSTFDVTAWYKISVQATQLKYDNKRRTHAYRMTYVVNTYAVNQMGSPYFNDSKYRGAHKAYNYWFTGKNTQVLNYEQEYNAAYYITLTNDNGPLASNAPPTGQDQFSKTFMATSEVRGQGQPGYINNPADSAAAFLYSVTDFQSVKLKIVGDPAWLQQGEVSVGVNPQTFNFAPFNADGGINYDSSEVVFTLSFNRPTDYNINTGIMDVNSTNGIPQQTFAYIATSCRNTFSKGKFEQELVGSLLPLDTASSKAANANGRAAATAGGVATGSRDTTNSVVSAADEANPDLWNDGTATQSTGARTEDEFNADNPPTPQPALPPGAPSSSGDVTPSDTQAPQNAGTTDKVVANEEETAAVNAYIAAGGTFPRGTGPITSGPLYDNVLAAKESLTARQQASAVPATTSAGPQLIAQDDQ